MHHLFFPFQKCVYVRHEILLDQDITARDFLLGVAGSVNGGDTASAAVVDEVNHALKSVGFTAQMEIKFVSALSGGWRMRLAIGFPIPL